MNPAYPIVLGLVVAFASGFMSYRFGYGVGYEHAENESLKQIVAAHRERDEARRQVLNIQKAQTKLVEAVDHENSKALTAIRRRHDAAFDKLRAAYETGCRVAAGVPEHPEAPGGDHERPGDRELSRQVSAGLGKLALAADLQTQQLIGCQKYVRAIQQ